MARVRIKNVVLKSAGKVLGTYGPGDTITVTRGVDLQLEVVACVEKVSATDYPGIGGRLSIGALIGEAKTRPLVRFTTVAKEITSYGCYKARWGYRESLREGTYVLLVWAMLDGYGMFPSPPYTIKLTLYDDAVFTYTVREKAPTPIPTPTAPTPTPPTPTAPWQRKLVQGYAKYIVPVAIAGLATAGLALLLRKK